MITNTIIANSIGIAKKYFPNLFNYLTQKEFETFIRKAYNHTSEINGEAPIENFIVPFLNLIEEHHTNKSNDIRNEFGYFNYLLGAFSRFSNQREFKNLLLGNIYNFKNNSFHHSLGEIAACLDLCQQMTFQKYEHKLDNGKRIDFTFSSKEGEIIYVDAFTIDFKKEKYEKENFETFLNHRLFVKFKDKTSKLKYTEKKSIYVIPILSGFKKEIIVSEKPANE